jgi:HprK-related kinase A
MSRGIDQAFAHLSGQAVTAVSPAAIRGLLANGGIFVDVGPFTFHLRTSILEAAEDIALLYGDYPIHDRASFSDFHVSLERQGGARRWIRPQARFVFDGRSPFQPLPLAQALPLLEWGLNWAIATHAHQYLIIHAAAIEKDGYAVIMPAPPGSGKSTLCAGLVSRGWRLLSDELALLSLGDPKITPLSRPISLKNRSIDVVGEFSDGAVISRKVLDTAKGTVALMKAPKESIERISQSARPAWVIFPKYEQGTEARLEKRSKARTFMEIGTNAFNYSIHGAKGFNTLTRLIDGCDCFDFTYSRLDDAVSIFSQLEPPAS